MSSKPRPPLVKDKPFISHSELSGRWYFVQSWREMNGLRVAYTKWDVTVAIQQIISDAVPGYDQTNHGTPVLSTEGAGEEK